nr:error-prone DNA polymerase [Acetobacteraceae bacterium]
LKAHPLALLRADLAASGCSDTRALTGARPGARVRLAGLVLVRQRPGSAKGIVFVTVEDEHGHANLVVMPPVLARHRAAIIGARLMVVDGVVERQDYGAAPIIHIRARRVEDRSDLLATLHVRGEGGAVWDRALARADEVKTPQRDARAPRGHPRNQAKLDPRTFIPGSRDFR